MVFRFYSINYYYRFNFKINLTLGTVNPYDAFSKNFPRKLNFILKNWRDNDSSG